MTPTLDHQALIEWFLHEKRDLPWRNNPSPYAVWVSEVMLQQTQVSVVIPYFEKWMKRFPTVGDLAKASEGEVVKLWEGLGYYSRARNLLEGARYVCAYFDGKVPSDPQELAKIKGLGPYTIGAIRSFAFHEKAAAVDGNVLRVVTRYFQITDDISKGKTVKTIQQTVLEVLPDDGHWIVNEALIELGATICTKKPNCSVCPLKRSCRSRMNGKVAEIPFKSVKLQTIQLSRAVTVIYHPDGSLLLRRGAPGKIMHGLHEFPFLEIPESEITLYGLKSYISKEMQLKVIFQKNLDKVSHSFTQYRAQLHPYLFITEEKKAVEGYEWYGPEEIQALAFSSGHRKVLQNLITSSDWLHKA